MRYRIDPIAPIGGVRARSPAQLSDRLVAWFVSNIGTFTLAVGGIPTTPGQPIGRWMDQSGNGNNATQATTGQRPRLSSSTVLGFNAVEASNTGIYQGLNTPPITLLESEDVTILCVSGPYSSPKTEQTNVAIRYNDTSLSLNGDPLIGSYSSNPGEWLNRGRVDTTSSIAVATPPSSAGNIIIANRLNDGTIRIRESTNTPASTTGALGPRTSSASIAILGTNLVSNLTSAQQILEIAVWGRRLSGGEERSLITYCKRRYGL